VASGSGGVAFVAGRKVGKAVQRNRSRRLLRAAWSQIADRAEEGTDVVLVARRNILEIGSAEVAGEISALLFGGAR
jgi:ribonuclease P protein component